MIYNKQKISKYVCSIITVASLVLTGCDFADVMSRPLSEVLSGKTVPSAVDVIGEYENSQDTAEGSGQAEANDYDLSSYYEYNGAVNNITDRIDHEKYLNTSNLDQLRFFSGDERADVLNNVWAGLLYSYNIDVDDRSYEFYSTCELPRSIIRELNVNCARIPQNILDAFFVNGQGLLVITEDISRFSAKTIDGSIGLTNCPEAIIYILFDAPECPYYDTFYHELGHYIAYVTDFPDESDEWVGLWENSELAKELNDHVSNSCTEFFAEMCYWYFDNPEALKERDPDVYRFIDDIIQNFSEYSGYEESAA